LRRALAPAPASLHYYAGQTAVVLPWANRHLSIAPRSPIFTTPRFPNPAPLPSSRVPRPRVWGRLILLGAPIHWFLAPFLSNSALAGRVPLLPLSLFSSQVSSLPDPHPPKTGPPTDRSSPCRPVAALLSLPSSSPARQVLSSDIVHRAPRSTPAPLPRSSVPHIDSAVTRLTCLADRPLSFFPAHGPGRPPLRQVANSIHIPTRRRRRSLLAVPYPGRGALPGSRFRTVARQASEFAPSFVFSLSRKPSRSAAPGQIPPDDSSAIFPITPTALLESCSGRRPRHGCSHHDRAATILCCE
jgi:hypothetical protein